MNLYKIFYISLLFSVATAVAEDDTKFQLHTGAHWGQGKMYNTVKSIPSRTMNTIDVQATPLYNLGAFSVGALLEFRYSGQNTLPNEVGNQNLGSTFFPNYVFGIAAQYLAQDWKFILSLDFMGRYKLDRKDALDRESIYSSPLGLHLVAAKKILQDFYLDLSLSYLAYSANELGGVENDLDKNNLKHWNAALGISKNFSF
jgi:hypothetical protein